MITISENPLKYPGEQKRDEKKPKSDSFKSIHTESSKKKRPVEEGLPSPLALMQGVPPHLSEASPSFAAGVLEIAPIFEKLTSVMTLLHAQGDRETTFYLDAGDSPFSGMQIVIKEFSTAPKAFNIELIGHRESVSLLQAHLGDLIGIFHAQAHPFKINRLETLYLKAERHLVERKESLSDEQEDL
jgi:hypothetical protein